MTPELRAAVNLIHDPDSPHVWYGADGALCVDMEYRDAAELLAEACLVEHDETPIDEAWLRSVGFPKDEHPSRDGRPVFYVVRTPAHAHGVRLSAVVLTIYSDGIGSIPKPPLSYPSRLIHVLAKTRGDVRRLCRALGITLTEAKGAER